VWFILLIASLIVLIYSLARDRMTPAWLQGTTVDRPISLFSLSIASAVFFISFVMIAGGAVIGGRVSEMTGVSYVEVRPSLQATADIVRDTYQTSALFGIGPNKFVDAWRLYRDSSLNSTVFWNTDFVAGVGYIPSFFVTTGVVGGLLWVLFLGFFTAAGIRMLLNAVSPDRTWYFIGTSAFVTGLYVWGLSVVYVPGSMLIMLAALCTGLVLTARNAIEPHREREISLVGNRRSGFILVSMVMGVVILAMSALYIVGRQYASAYIFSQSERAVVVGDIEKAKQRVDVANQLMSDDRYLRRSAEIEYTELITVLNLPTDTPNLEQRFRDALRNSITSAGRAVAIDGTDANNWGVLGAIYSAVVPLRIDGAYDRAKEALVKSRELDPQNPIRTLMLARLAFGNGNVEEARALMNEAIRQKPDYIDAAFMLSQLEISAGNVDGAIDSTVRIIQLEPQNPARYFQLGVLELSKGDAERGALALEAAIGLDPQYANARYYLAFAYDQLGESAKAKAQLEKVLETNPDNQEVKQLILRLAEGQKISTVPQSTPSPTASQTTTTTEGDANVIEKSPDSPLLTPVNPVSPEPDTTPRGE
jgi:cytochrome c-type biogenesis protein CcmH/NrfG